MVHAMLLLKDGGDYLGPFLVINNHGSDYLGMAGVSIQSPNGFHHVSAQKNL